jgi:prevent-host-death family protein
MAFAICATVCYTMDRVGIRELRQNLSVHLRRVKRGKSLEVTEHGRPVAVLSPLPKSVGTRELLIAGGKLEPARSTIADLGAPTASLKPSRSLTEALADERGERL